MEPDGRHTNPDPRHDREREDYDWGYAATWSQNDIYPQLPMPERNIGERRPSDSRQPSLLERRPGRIGGRAAGIPYTTAIPSTTTTGERSRAWTFTINLPDTYGTTGNLSQIETFSAQCKQFYDTGEGSMQYMCGQLETAPSTGRLHIQGYVYYKSTIRLSTIRTMCEHSFGVFPHASISRGTPEQNRDYCSKKESAVAESFREHGNCPRQGRRVDLAAVASEIAAGTDMSTIAACFPTQYIRYHNGFQALMNITMIKPRTPDNPISVQWWFGPTGLGKSKDAFQHYPNSYIKMNCKWWDGYQGQSTVIMDDYRPGMCLFSELLRILDRYPHRVEAKGTSMPLSATSFVITTTSRPEILWNGRTDEDVAQLLRRINIIKQYTPDGITILKDDNTPYIREYPPAIADTFFLELE